MFIKRNDIWVADEWLSPVTKWRLGRRLEKYPDKVTLPVLGLPFVIVLLLALLFQSSLVGAIIAGVLTGFLMVAMFIVSGPERRCRLVAKLHRQGRVFPRDSASFRVLEPLMREASASKSAQGDVSQLAASIHEVEIDCREQWSLPVDDRRRNLLQALDTRLNASSVNYAAQALRLDADELHAAIDERIDAEQAKALDMLKERMDRYEKLAGESMTDWLRAMAEVSISRELRAYDAYLASQK